MDRQQLLEKIRSSAKVNGLSDQVTRRLLLELNDHISLMETERISEDEIETSLGAVRDIVAAERGMSLRQFCVCLAAPLGLWIGLVLISAVASTLISLILNYISEDSLALIDGVSAMLVPALMLFTRPLS